jgi:hypothetical protein
MNFWKLWQKHGISLRQNTMDNTDNGEQWFALQLEERRRREDELLKNDPAYYEWLDYINAQRTEHEIQGEESEQGL